MEVHCFAAKPHTSVFQYETERSDISRMDDPRAVAEAKMKQPSFIRRSGSVLRQEDGGKESGQHAWAVFNSRARSLNLLKGRYTDHLFHCFQRPGKTQNASGSKRSEEAQQTSIAMKIPLKTMWAHTVFIMEVDVPLQYYD